MMDKFEIDLSSTDGHLTYLEEIILHLEYNPILSKVEGITDKFWDMFVVDVFINNNDRNNGNWGLLFNNNVYSLAPIYDNGAAFTNKNGETKIARINSDDKLLQQNLDTSTTTYYYKEKQLFVKDIKNLPYDGFKQAILRNVPLMQKRIDKICLFIDELPSEDEGFQIISDARKLFYKNMLKIRLERLLVPIYEDLNNKDSSPKGLKESKIF